jgi:hypothetical protein
MAKGFIYIMTNPCLQGMVKIGYATDVEERRKQLSTTALPYDYEVYATYETPGKLEDKKLHKLIDNLNPDLRVSKNREFFIMSPEDAYGLLESIATISGSLDKLKKVWDATSLESEHKKRKPPVNFALCGIPVGAELVFIEDPSVKVIVESDRKVLCDGELTSLSAVAAKLKGCKAIAGPSYFTYNGKLVADIAEETMWKM